jgi:hypothetical protein
MKDIVQQFGLDWHPRKLLPYQLSCNGLGGVGWQQSLQDLDFHKHEAYGILMPWCYFYHTYN